MHGRLAAVERPQQVSELPHRTALDAECAVPACAADPRAQPAHLLLRDLDRVETAPGDPDRRATELSEGVLRASEGVGMLLRHEPGALVAAVLLVAQDEQDERGRRAGLVRREERRDAHRHAALHVERAPAPDVAVRELASERGPAPALAGRRDDVDVAVQQERRPAAGTGMARDEVRPPRRSFEPLRLDPVRAQQRLDVGDTGLLVPGRVRRVEADQLLQEGDRIDHSSSRAPSSRSISAGVL